MSGNSSGVNNQLIQEFGGSFFHWVSTEVLPYVLGSVLAAFVLVGIILNIILLVVYFKRRLHHDPTNDVIPQIAVVDLVASFAVIMPSSVAALLHEWPLSDTLCTVHGILVTWFHLLSFALVILIFVERVVKAWNPRLHDSTFNTHLFVVIISIIVWAGDLLVSFLPVLGIGTIAFNKHQSQCSVVHKDHPILTHVLFSVGLYCSPLICLICFSLLIEKRRRSILHEQNEERNKLIDLKDDEGLPGDEKWAEAGGNVPPVSTQAADKEGTGKSSPQDVVKKGPSKAWDKSATDNGKTPLFKKNSNTPASKPDKSGKGPCAKKTTREEVLEQYNRRMSRPKSQTLMRRMFRDTEDEKDHHQAMTALITWSVLEVCWIWYLVAALLEMYSGADVWGGWHIVGVLMGDVTYCIKPIIYLAHNRHYRQASKETIPLSIRDTADAVTRKMSEAVGKVENMIFHSPGATKSKTSKLTAAVATQQLAMRWKLKTLGKFGAGKTSPSADNKPPETSSGKEAAVAKPSSSNKESGSSTKPALMGSAIAAAAMAQAAEAKKEAAAGATRTKSPAQKLLTIPETVHPPATPGMPSSSRQGTPASRPATKSSVLLSMQGSEGALTPASPHPPSTAASTGRSADDDMAQLMNPHSVQT